MKQGTFSRGFAVAVLMACVAQAQATNLFGDTVNNNQTYNQPASHATANGGTGGQGGSSVATGGNSNATGGSVLASGNSSNSNKNDNKNTNSNLNAQGQQQGQGQEQSIKNSGNSSSQSGIKNSGNSSSGGNTQTNTGNNANLTVEGDNYEAQKRAPVSTAYSAGLTSTNGTCFGSASAGVQFAGVGLTGGTTTFDENCDIRYDAIALREAGQTKAAVARLCQKPAMAEAMKAAGTPCTNASVWTAKTSANYSEAPVAKYEHTDPIVRARLGLPPLK